MKLEKEFIDIDAVSVESDIKIKSIDKSNVSPV